MVQIYNLAAYLNKRKHIFLSSCLFLNVNGMNFHMKSKKGISVTRMPLEKF